MRSTPPERQPPERASPYLGLSPYGEGDAELFFGRHAERDLVIANLLTSRLTVMYGPSGVGKSSLLRAGVLPRLRDGIGVPTGGSPRAVVFVDAWQGDSVGAILRRRRRRCRRGRSLVGRGAGTLRPAAGRHPAVDPGSIRGVLPLPRRARGQAAERAAAHARARRHPCASADLRARGRARQSSTPSKDRQRRCSATSCAWGRCPTRPRSRRSQGRSSVSSQEPSA